MEPEGRAIAVAEMLRAGYSGQQVSKALKIGDAGGSVLEMLAALREPDDPAYLDKLRDQEREETMAERDADYSDYYKGRMEELRRDLRWWIELGGKLEAIIADHPRGRIQTAGSANLADDLKFLIDREDRALTRAEQQRDRLLEAVKVHRTLWGDMERPSDNPLLAKIWDEDEALYELAAAIESEVGKS